MWPMIMMPLPLISLLSTLVATRTARAAPDSNSTLQCFNSAITWYNSYDMNPCEQYQQLMMQCDSDYKLPLMSIPAGNNGPTTCSSQQSKCCCNSVAFSLAMACLNCQTGGDANGNGYTAPPQTFNRYLNACSPVGIQSIDSTIQQKVCLSGPVIQRWAYELNHEDGSWNYTENSIFAARLTNAGTGDSTPTQCKGEALAASGGVGTSQNAGKEADNGASPVGAIVGAVVGAVVLMLLVFFIVWWFWLRKRPVHPHGPGSPSDFDLLPSARQSRTTSIASLEPLPVFVYNNPYVNAASQQRERPETQTFSELTLPVPISVPSDFQSSLYSQTPFSAHPPSVDGGWRNRAPSVIHSVGSRSTQSRSQASRSHVGSSRGAPSVSGSQTSTEKSQKQAGPPPEYSPTP